MLLLQRGAWPMPADASHGLLTDRSRWPCLLPALPLQPPRSFSTKPRTACTHRTASCCTQWAWHRETRSSTVHSTQAVPSPATAMLPPAAAVVAPGSPAPELSAFILGPGLLPGLPVTGLASCCRIHACLPACFPPVQRPLVHIAPLIPCALPLFPTLPHQPHCIYRLCKHISTNATERKPLKWQDFNEGCLASQL